MKRKMTMSKSPPRRSSLVTKKQFLLKSLTLELVFQNQSAPKYSNFLEKYNIKTKNK